ncbi:MAG: PqqD family protein [Chloroflexi bacterium]|nr:PqqD family protein [Chloroflexota bacterium]
MDSTRFSLPHPQVAARVVDDSAVIVLADVGEVEVLNAVGTFIWELIDGSRRVQEIVDAVEAEYDVGADQARRDVEEFLQTLVDTGALVLAEHTLE